MVLGDADGGDDPGSLHPPWTLLMPGLGADTLGRTDVVVMVTTNPPEWGVTVGQQAEPWAFAGCVVPRCHSTGAWCWPHDDEVGSGGAERPLSSPGVRVSGPLISWCNDAECPTRTRCPRNNPSGSLVMLLPWHSWAVSLWIPMLGTKRLPPDVAPGHCHHMEAAARAGRARAGFRLQSGCGAGRGKRSWGEAWDCGRGRSGRETGRSRS